MYAGLEEGSRGIFWDGHLSHPWEVMGWNLLGALRKAKMLRVAVELEFKGMDIIKHGEAAYPSSAWVEYQYIPHQRNSTTQGPALPPNMNNNGISNSSDHPTSNGVPVDNKADLPTTNGVPVDNKADQPTTNGGPVDNQAFNEEDEKADFSQKRY